MKKLLFLIQLTAAVILYSSVPYADDDGYGWRGHGHHGGDITVTTTDIIIHSHK